LKQRKNQ
jgi:hypothetical protein